MRDNRERRRAAALSQEKLAEKADLHPNYIGEVERGEKTISVDALLRISGALKINVTEFFPGHSGGKRFAAACFTAGSPAAFSSPETGFRTRRQNRPSRSAVHPEASRVP